MLDGRAKDQAELLTIGYEGATIEDFVATLRLSGVTCLLDIRELPLSRKKGFSKRALCQAVEEAGIAYLHIKSLGDPKPGREAARSGDYEKFEQIFCEHLASDEAQQALENVMPIAISGGACLLCFERNHKGCHRSMVADKFYEKAGIKVRHIGVKHGLAGEQVT